MQDLTAKIVDLKQRKKAMILAHYYQKSEVQDIADFVGDSLAMAKKACTLGDSIDQIIVCGVSFMAETVKILCRDKLVLLPVKSELASCSLAEAINEEDLIELKARYPNAAFVCYINSSAVVKAYCDICITSTNAVSIIKSLEERQIVVLPDKNLAFWVQSQIPEKEIIAYNGCCHCHDSLTIEDVKLAQQRNPNALFVVHPEVKKEVWEKADFVGSTSSIIKYINNSSYNQFVVGTERGILHQLQLNHPNYQYYLLSPKLYCKGMKAISLENLYQCLESEEYRIELEECDDNLMDRAAQSLEKMLKKTYH